MKTYLFNWNTSTWVEFGSDSAATQMKTLFARTTALNDFITGFNPVVRAKITMKLVSGWTSSWKGDFEQGVFLGR